MTNASNFQNPYAADVIGLWDFKPGEETKDTGLDDGIAQNGHLHGYGHFSHGWFNASDKKSYFDVEGGNEAPFQIAEGTLMTEFKLTGDPSRCDDYMTVVSRGELKDAHQEGYFDVRVSDKGSVQVLHKDAGAQSYLCTANNFANDWDVVRVTYSWDAATGTSVLIENVTQGTSYEGSTDVTGLTFDVTDNDDESFTIGAQETDDGQYGKYLDGKIDYVAVLDSAVLINDPLDGVVTGSNAGELIDVAYTGDPEGDMIDAGDAIDPAAGPDDDVVDALGGDDTVKAGEGDDTVYAGSGDDTVEGGAGDDVIYGDANAPGSGAGTVRESFEWDLAPDPNGPAPIENGDDLSGGFTQNTGNVDVTYSVVHESAGVDTEFTDEDLNVNGIDTGGGPADDNSGLYSVLNGDPNKATYQLEFSQPVTDVSFNINDIDGDGVVRVLAFDPSGAPIEVTLMGGGKLTLLDTDTVAGADTADSQGGYADPDTASYNLNVAIAGPVGKIVIEHDQDGPNNTGVIVTDVYYDVTTGDTGPDGDDTLLGGAGDDTIFGEGGDDTIDGGTGDDTLDGGDGNDDIKGGDGDDTITGGQGTNTLDGGTGDDDITGGSGVDTITGGAGNDTVDGGAGDDVIDTSGPLGTALPDRGFPSYNGLPAIPADLDPFNDRDTVFGGDGDDIILTGDDNDVIDGGAGNDTIDGGIDDDTIDGGTGDDLIIGGEGSDTIQGGDGNDTIYGGLDPSFPDALNIRDDGTDGPADPVTDNGKDVIDGGAGDDTIFGQDDDDTITGGAGNDYLDGGIDDDTVSGGDGDDTVIGGQGDDILAGDAGDDTIDGGTGDDQITGGSGDDVIDGGEGDNVMDGGTGDDDITGGSGVDTITGGDGNDTVNSGGGDDVIDTSGVTDTLPDRGFPAFNGMPAVLADPDPFNDRDTVNAGDGDDIIITGDDNDTIDAGAGNDTVDAGIDDDTVMAGAGDDTVVGGEGQDTIQGGAGDDVLYGGQDPANPDPYHLVDDGSAGPADPLPDNDKDVIDGGDGNDTIYGQDDDDTLSGGAGDDYIDGGIDDDTIDGGTGDDTLLGGQGDDTVSGDDGDDVIDGGEGDNILSGGDGDDDITGGSGDDQITGGQGADIVDAGDGDDVIDTSRPAGSNLPDRGFPAYNGLPAVPADPDPFDDRDVVDAGAGNDIIITGDDNDIIDGGAGDDTIDAGLDDDTVDGGAGDDVIVGGEGSDTIDGGAGDDTLDYSDNASAVRIYARAGMAEEDGSGETDEFSGIENFIGSDHADTIFTDENTASVDSGAGNDFVRVLGSGDATIDTGDGNDFVLAESGRASVDLGEGNDKLLSYSAEVNVDGGAGDDVIRGGSGDDTIDGGQGDDVLSGGGGQDTFVYKSDGGTDTILDFDTSQDILDLTDLDITFADIEVVETDRGVDLRVGGQSIVQLESVTADDVATDMFAM